MTRREREANPSALELRRRAMAGDDRKDASDPWNLPDASCDHGEIDPTVCPRCQELAAARAGVADWLATGALRRKCPQCGGVGEISTGSVCTLCGGRRSVTIDGPDEIGRLARGDAS